MLKDRFGRTIDYMRVSITDRCNLRCAYCMPDGIAPAPAEALLTGGEIAFVCRQAAGLGIDRFKLTGGEPLVRPDCAKLVAALKGIGGVRQVTLTTNGVLLRARLDELLDAGLDAVNVSLDTTDRAQYRAITGVDALEAVMASIRAAAGRLPVKINCVAQDGVNADAPLSLAALARELPVDVRFIEMMPVGAGKRRKTVPNADILATIERAYGRTVPDARAHGNGPAVYRRAEGFLGGIGFISAVSGGFCRDCNRLRLMSTGELKPCLCYADAIPLRDILRGAEGDRERRVREKIIQAVRSKPEAHCFERPDVVTEDREMARIGG